MLSFVAIMMAPQDELVAGKYLKPSSDAALAAKTAAKARRTAGGRRQRLQAAGRSAFFRFVAVVCVLLPDEALIHVPFLGP